MTDRIKLAPEVETILQQTSSEATLLASFLTFGEALLSEVEIDQVVMPDARFHDLEAMGFPQGPEGLKVFRRMINGAFPDESIVVKEVRFVGDDIIEVELLASATHRGEFMGIQPTNRQVHFAIHARDRFEGNRVAERWDRGDTDDLMRQLTA
jgi:predicted ester cyclase